MRTRRFHNPAINSLTVVQLILMLMSASAQFSSYHGGNDGFWTVSLGPTDPLSPSSPFLQEHDSKSRWSAIPSSKSKSKGRIKVDLRGNIFKLTRADPPFNTTTLQEKDDDSLSMTIDPMSTWRLLKLSFSATSSLASAFMGTLRLLAPLILARRTLNAAGDLGYDYMTGRYIRTTYSRLESLYLQYYELPAVFRAFSRTAAQITVLLILSKASEFLLQTVRLCKCGYHCRWWCALIWISLVVGIGQIFASLVAQWGGPLRIQVISSQSHTSRNFAARVFTQPWHILQWMRDPEAWISMVASNPQSSSRLLQPYTANPILFPTTWAPIKVFSVLAVCKAVSSVPEHFHQSNDQDHIHSLVRQLLVHFALNDEWYRVFISEKRLALGAVVGLCYLISTIWLAFTTSSIDLVAAVVMIPTLMAAIVSGWMNFVIFWNRLERQDRRAALQTFGIAP